MTSSTTMPIHMQYFVATGLVSHRMPAMHRQTDESLGNYKKNIVSRAEESQAT